MDDLNLAISQNWKKKTVIPTHTSRLDLHQYLWHSLLFIYISQAPPLHLKTRF
jgi:hypothetical protein